MRRTSTPIGLVLISALAVCALAAGCGDESSDSPAATTPVNEEPGPLGQDEVYNSCIRQLAETSVSPPAAQQTCAQARALFSECLIAASEKSGVRHDDAVATCESEAEEGLAGLAESAG